MSNFSADSTPLHAPVSGGNSSALSGKGGGHFCKGSCASSGHGSCSKPLSHQCNSCLKGTIRHNPTLRAQAIQIAQARGWQVPAFLSSPEASTSSEVSSL